MSDKKKKETQQPQEEPQEKEDSSVEENQPQEDPVEEKLRRENLAEELRILSGQYGAGCGFCLQR